LVPPWELEALIKLFLFGCHLEIVEYLFLTGFLIIRGESISKYSSYRRRYNYVSNEYT